LHIFVFLPAMIATMHYDEFGFLEEEEEQSVAEAVEAVPLVPHVPMREQFPEAGSDYLGGHSTGWEYRSIFGGSKLVYTYEMVKQFLQEEGYGDVPIPATADELKLFRRPRQSQLQLFAERGYIHNPIKILFSNERGQRNNLILCIYNEQAPDHLLRFHGVLRPELTK